jgi:hypothetical protein
MKFANATALIAALIVTGLQTAPATAAEPADARQAEQGSSETETRNSNRQRAREAQAEAAQHAAEAVLSATKLDLDIRLIGPTSIAGEL